jgi:putative restriction endonuclease
MNYWWVNQNQTYSHEVGGGYMWSPKTNSNGHRNRFYDSMTEVAIGDTVFSFCDTLIKAVGVVTGPCQSAPKPTEFGATGSYWSAEGWFVPVRFIELTNPIRPKDWMGELAPTLPSVYSPLQPNGNGNQGVYLAPVPEPMAAVLVKLLKGQVEDVLAAHHPKRADRDDQEIERIKGDKAITQTQREQLVMARVGQGLFRSRVAMLEPGCRVTGVTDDRFLRASHIKPWSVSTDAEKLDGANGLLLAPHVDHLFDRGFITFDQAGSLVRSHILPSEVFAAWFTTSDIAQKALTKEQAVYMDHHRHHVFQM